MANEQMNFPETWEEYEKEYGFNDSKEVYTNNSRLIQSFRVKQWLDHLPSIQPKAKTDVLDKIRAEFIARYPKNCMGEPELGGRSCVFSLNQILQIIDKYSTESVVEQ